MFNNRDEILRTEITLLEQEWLIDAKLAKKLLVRYPENHEWALDRFVPLITGAGAVLVGLGFILYFAANWGYIADIWKTVLLIAAVLSTGTAGYILSENKNMPKTGAALIILSSLLYGASIFLLGQIYNLGGSLTGALLLWAIGVMPMAYYTGYRLLMILGVGLLVGSVFSFLEDHHVWFVWDTLLISVGTILLFASIFHKKRYPEFAVDLVRIGSVIILGVSYFLTFDFTPYMTWVPNDSFSLLARFVPLTVALVLIVWLRFKNYLRTLEASGIALHLVIIGAIEYIRTMGVSLFSGVTNAYTIVSFICTAFSVYYFLFLLFVAYIWVHRNSRELINLSVAFMGIYILTKFFDAFWNLMDRGLSFIFGGIILVGVGYLMERVRKRLLANISR